MNNLFITDASYVISNLFSVTIIIIYVLAYSITVGE